MAAALDMATELVAAAVYGEADNVAHILTQHPATLNAVAEVSHTVSQPPARPESEP